MVGFTEGRAATIRAESDQPRGRGRLCERGRLVLEHLYHPDRLDTPLRRLGPRGSGRFEPVGWEEALDEVAARLEDLRHQSGAETLALARGTYRSYHWEARRFLNLFGSPNLTGPNPVCHCPSVIMDMAVTGAMHSPDLERTQCMVIWGSARSMSAPVTKWAAISAARRRGAKMIVVDPRRTKEATLADLWLPLRPGSDAALLLGWLHVILGEGLCDHQFLREHTVGLDALGAQARLFPPSRVAGLTWLPEGLIVDSARLYATTRPAVITWGQGLDKLGPNTDAALHARAALRAVTGNLDVPGGELMGAAPLAQVVPAEAMELNELLPESQRTKLLGGDEHPLFSFGAWERIHASVDRLAPGTGERVESSETVVAAPNAVLGAMLSGLPYPVRALIVQAANPVMTLADPQRTLAALRRLELLVVMDYYLTPTAALADFVFPAACTLERDDLAVRGPVLVGLPRALEPLFERRPDYDLWMGLGRRMGQEEDWPWDTVEEALGHRLAPSGLSFAELCKKGAQVFSAEPVDRRATGFATPSGRVELRSSVLGALGLADLPDHAPLAEPDEDYPLLLITGSAFNPMYHSEQRQWPSARALRPDPLVTLHPATAEALGLVKGDWVLVETPRGAVRMRLRVMDKVHPAMADAQHGWWFPERSSAGDEPFGCLESNINVLVCDAPSDSSPGTGAWQQTGIPCRVRRAPGMALEDRAT